MTSTPTITTQIRALQTMPGTELATRYQELFGKPPRVHNAAWLRRQVGWKLQEQQLGGLSDSSRTRLDELVARIDLPLGTPATQPRRAAPPPRADAKTPMVGTVLTREWHGQQLRVEVVEDGFIWNATRYGSLTATVRAITNSNWNPKIFFGLTPRRTAQ